MKKFLLSFFILPFVFAFADEHAPVGERALSFNPPREESQNDAQNDGTAEEAAGCFWGGCQLNYYPISCHWVFALSAFQDCLGLEDGSIWQIDSYQAYQTRDWLTNDPVVITQNHEWFSSYKYRMFNKNLGSSVAVNLSLGPILNGEYSRWIVLLDHDRGVVILSDDSRWTISYRDRGILDEWAINDYIITGVNSGWDSNCPYILINSNMDNFIRAKQY
jgi:hypothetical protein